jgi:TetR/AcrR family transcriptional regulator, transcriptional repressor for nem operon
MYGDPADAGSEGFVRYAADRKEKTRATILGAAGKVFRREGYHAAGVDKVMAEAGLTAGGFYAHFESKQALLAEALEHAAADAGERLVPSTEGLSGREWVESFLGRYLSLEHCRVIEDGCPLAALVSEVARAEGPVKERFETLVRGIVSELGSHVGACGSPSCEERALAAVAMCVGGLGLARCVPDAAYAAHILESCRKVAAEMLSAERMPQAKVVSRRKGGNS